MKDIYTIQRPNQMTDRQAKIANTFEKSMLRALKAILTVSAVALFSLFSMAAYIGAGELGNRYETAKSIYQDHKLKQEKYRALNPNE